MNNVGKGLDIIALAGMGLVIGIVVNSRNSAALVNAVGNLFIGTFRAAASTIR
jgi:Na+/serine symporter